MSSQHSEQNLRTTLNSNPAGLAKSDPDAGVKYVELARCGHIPMEEQPRECIEAAVGFIRAICT